MGLDTSLVVTTDRRTYRMRVKNQPHQIYAVCHLPGFRKTQAKWDAIRRREAKYLRDNTQFLKQVNTGNLDFNYEISGSKNMETGTCITMASKPLSSSLKRFLL